MRYTEKYSEFKFTQISNSLGVQKTVPGARLFYKVLIPFQALLVSQVQAPAFSVQNDLGSISLLHLFPGHRQGVASTRPGCSKPFLTFTQRRELQGESQHQLGTGVTIYAASLLNPTLAGITWGKALQPPKATMPEASPASYPEPCSPTTHKGCLHTVGAQPLPGAPEEPQLPQRLCGHSSSMAGI